MSKSLLHDWESSIEKNKNNTEELLKIAEDIYNTAYARGKASIERPQSDLISRSALKNKFISTISVGRLEFEDIINLIDNAPTVAKDYDTGYQDGLEDGLNDIRPQGEWIMIKNSDGNLKCYECSNCGKNQGYISNYCEDCGSDMSGGKE